MSVKLHNDTANGTATIKASNTAGDVVVVTPEFSADMGVRPVLMTAQNSTSGTSIDFTGIPSWAKKITVMLRGVSTNGTSTVEIRLGDSGGVESTGYVGGQFGYSGGVFTNSSTTGFIVSGSLSSNTRNGMFTISFLDANIWCINGGVHRTDEGAIGFTTGSKTLSGILDRIRITTVNGTDTFDAGQINIMYEG